MPNLFYQFLFCKDERIIATFLVYLRQISKMKRIAILFCVLSLGITIISCGFPGGSSSISQREYSHYYEMKARFNHEKTTEVERWLDQELSSGDMSFTNTNMDGEITLDNKTTFFIKKSPGHLHIKFDKKKNSDEAYFKIKSVCEGLKDVVR